MADNDGATNSPAQRVPKTSKESINKSIQNIAKEKEKVAQKKSSQTDIQDYFSNNIYHALSSVDGDDDDDPDNTEEYSTASSTLSGEKRKNTKEANNIDFKITSTRPQDNAEIIINPNDTRTEEMIIDEDSESEVSVTPIDNDKSSENSATSTSSSASEILEVTSGGSCKVLPIPNKIVPVVTPRQEKKKKQNTYDSSGSKSNKKGSSLKKPTYQVRNIPQRPSEQKRVIDVPLTEIRRHIWRYEMKVNVPAPQDGENSLETIRGKFIDFFENLSQADNKLILFPYRSSDFTSGSITKWEELPDSSVILKKYLNGLRPKPKGGDIYVNVLLGHSKEFTCIQEDCEFFIQAQKAGIFKKQLACEDVMSVGHLLYSLRSINVEDYKQAFWEKYHIDLSLRWRIMQVEKGKYKKYDDLDQAPRALQIEVSKTDIRKASAAFRIEYSSKKTNDFLLGMRFCFIPDKENLVGAHATEKLRQAALMQLHFVKKLMMKARLILITLLALTRKSGGGNIKVKL